MDFISLIDGIVIPNADIDLQDYEDKEGIDLNLSLVGLVKKDEKIANFLTLIKSVKFINADFTFIDIQDEGEEDRINLNFSVSALIKKNQTIANISQYIENIKIKNADFIFANDSDELIIDSEIEAIDLKNTENFEISVNDISLRLFLKRTEKGGLSISSIYLKEVTIGILQKLIDNLIKSLKHDMESKGVFNIKVILSSGRIILKGDFKKSIFTIPFSVEFSVDSKKSLVKVEIEKIHLMKSLNVPEFIIQNIIMEAIKNNLTYDFVKTYKSYCLVNLRRIIPEFVTYNDVGVLISDGSVVLNISEKNNPVAHDQSEDNVKESKEPEKENLEKIEDSKND